MQKLVGGYIEAIRPFEDEDVVLICNEDGKISGLSLNRELRNEDGEIIEIIVGIFFICVAQADSEHFESLSDEQAQNILRNI